MDKCLRDMKRKQGLKGISETWVELGREKDVTLGKKEQNLHYVSALVCLQ